MHHKYTTNAILNLQNNVAYKKGYYMTIHEKLKTHQQDLMQKIELFKFTFIDWLD